MVTLKYVHGEWVMSVICNTKKMEYQKASDVAAVLKNSLMKKKLRILKRGFKNE